LAHRIAPKPVPNRLEAEKPAGQAAAEQSLLISADVDCQTVKQREREGTLSRQAEPLSGEVDKEAADGYER
jgi:hypothetical protein